MVRPPLTLKIWPVTKLERWPHKQRIACAISRATDLLNAMMPLESFVAITADSSFPAPWLRDR